MQEILKNIGKGTLYEFDRNDIYMPLPSRNRNDNNIKPTILSNKWYDKQGYHYIFKDNTLIVESNEYFSDSGYSIVDYINDIPSSIDLNVILRLKSESNENELAGFNMLCNLLSTNTTKRKIIIDITRLKFSEKMALDVDNLPDNVKITTSLDNDYKENYIFSNESFESWALNTNENNFQLLLTKLTPSMAERIKKMRDISFDFYQYAPSSIVNGTNEEKSMYAYNWCCNNISYDITATNTDGSLKNDRKDAADPIITYDRKKGVCEGRARLLKLLLNNYYMKVPCFCVKGMAGRLQHQWNEVILDDGTILDLDISRQNNRIANNHDEIRIYGYESGFKK